MKKKQKQKQVAILSMQRIINFGSVLQAYSLRELIREQTGAAVTFLDIDRTRSCRSLKSVQESSDYEQPAAYPSGLLQKAKRFLITKLSAYNKHLITGFMRDELKLDEKDQPVPDYVVIGSDEVFNHNGSSVCLQLHGDVQTPARVISYAAACGNARAEDVLAEDRTAVKQALERFEAISVRDKATAEYVKTLSGRDTVHHLDPVLVGDLYKRPHRPVGLKNYMVVYAYGHRIRTAEEIAAIQAYAGKHHLKTVAIGGSQFWCDYYIPMLPFRVLDYFYYADCVVTDTFHGTIFSVINHKRFAVLSRETNRAKIEGLLEDLGLSERQLDRIDCLEQVLTTQINYDRIEEVLNGERIRTKEYLTKYLGESS